MENKDEIDVRKFDLVFFDTELTGLDAKHEIIELGFVKAKAGTFEVITEGSFKIRPTDLAGANHDSLVISGYSEEGWAGALSLKEALTEFLKYTEGAMLVGHNLPMDWFYLKKSLAQCELQPNYYYKGLDTYSLSWAKLRDIPEIRRFSLSELAPHFNINQGTAHRALDDARTTYQVFVNLMKL